MSTITHYRFLEQRPSSAYRQLFIKGTRIRAELVYRAHIHAEEPMTAEELAADFGLPLDAVLEAIDYCRSNSAELAADLANEDALITARGQQDPGYRQDARPRILAVEQYVRLRSR